MNAGWGHPAYNRMWPTETSEVASEIAPTGGKEKEERERFLGAFLEADAAVFHLAAVAFEADGAGGGDFLRGL